MTLSSKHRIPFKPRRRGSSAHLAGFSSRQGSRFIYTYDSMGRMLTRDDGTDLTQFTWDDEWNCIKEVTGESETVYHIPEGQILSFTRDGVTYQAHADALGSIRMITDESGDVVARHEFYLWGRAISTAENPTLAGFPMRFIGALGVRFDELTGLYYMRARWQDPTIQRFVSRDPIGINGGQNLYTYCANVPSLFNDPDGLQPGFPLPSQGRSRPLVSDRLDKEVRKRWGASDPASEITKCLTEAIAKLDQLKSQHPSNSKYETDLRTIATDLQAIAKSPDLSFGYANKVRPGIIDYMRTFRYSKNRTNEGVVSPYEVAEYGAENATINISPGFWNACGSSYDRLENCARMVIHELYHVYRGRMYEARRSQGRDPGRYDHNLDHGPDTLDSIYDAFGWPPNYVRSRNAD